MIWLYSLLGVLIEAELLEVKKLRLIGKEKLVFDALLAHSIEAEPEDICTEIGISETYFYKINSVLLDKIFAHLVPDNPYHLLEWLKKKELYALLKNELKAQIQLPQNSDYFLNTFRLLIDLPYKFYDDKLSRQVASFYLKSLPNASESDKKYVQFHLIFADCNRFAASKNPIQLFPYSEKELLAFEAELAQSNHYLAQYYLFRTLCNYYKYYVRNAELSLSYLQKAMNLNAKIAYFFPINLAVFLRLLYADALLGFLKVEEAFLLYKEIFDEGINESMYGFYYHCEQFALCAISLKKYAKAEHLLNTYFEASIQRKNDIYATRGILTYAKLYLSTGELKKALSYINKGMEINEKSFYLPFEIQLRSLENIYFYLQKDFEFAKQLCVRNQKFIHNQKSLELSKNYRQLFKLINTFIICQEQKKDLKAEQVHEITSIESSFGIIYCNLISSLYKALKKEIADYI
mgnify:CR=1 FL=1